MKGFILGGAYYRREICVSTLAGLIIGWTFVSKCLNVQLVILVFWRRGLLSEFYGSPIIEGCNYNSVLLLHSQLVNF